MRVALASLGSRTDLRDVREVHGPLLFEALTTSKPVAPLLGTSPVRGCGPGAGLETVNASRQGSTCSTSTMLWLPDTLSMHSLGGWRLRLGRIALCDSPFQQPRRNPFRSPSGAHDETFSLQRGSPQDSQKPTVNPFQGTGSAAPLAGVRRAAGCPAVAR